MLKLYFDEDVSPVVCKILRSRGHDCASAHELAKCGIPDVEQLEFSVSDGRILITHNRIDFAELAVEWCKLGRRHAGIVMVFRENRKPSEIPSALVRVLYNYDQADWVNITAYA